MAFQVLESYAVVARAEGNWNFGKPFPLLTGLTREIFGYNQSPLEALTPHSMVTAWTFYSSKESRDIVWTGFVSPKKTSSFFL